MLLQEGQSKDTLSTFVQEVQRERQVITVRLRKKKTEMNCAAKHNTYVPHMACILRDLRVGVASYTYS